ncbi:putative transmembrane protein [Pseudomonas saudimassiliensis]|uniref:GDT1 family protein n=1 Tax=Pseudomonas saudimassiliensis TaxID=1461581 RepID=A0A078MKJ2_9PSED|nr:TMEM165/GDT1 family protein [Pseudomonas saudimassiliensis]CEA05952.1 putative transmembrane protein [Pseudomonas saudimassiliensis]CEF27409.1 putative transmembrane protein [Pseudomonas saudimassiliensis]
MEAFFVSTGVVTLAEIGDKTQLLALLLAARFRRPWPIIWGILFATIANHALAGAVGQLIAGLLSDTWLYILLAISFLAVAAWTLVPDKLDEDDTPPISRYGAFMAALVAFFLAEMGDKTQVATVVLAAQFDAYLWVVLGTTLGMMLANVPVVFLGHAVAGKLPLGLIRGITAVIFLLLGVYAGWLAWS